MRVRLRALALLLQHDVFSLETTRCVLVCLRRLVCPWVVVKTTARLAVTGERVTPRFVSVGLQCEVRLPSKKYVWVRRARVTVPRACVLSGAERRPLWCARCFGVKLN